LPLCRFFTIPVPASVWIFIAIIAAILIAVFLLLVLPVTGFRIYVYEDRIEASSPIMHRAVVLRSDVESVSVVNLSEAQHLKPRVRLFGAGILGYNLGWFRLADGSKAFLAVSADRAVAIKLRDGSYVIITPSDFDGFLVALKSFGWI